VTDWRAGPVVPPGYEFGPQVAEVAPEVVALAEAYATWEARAVEDPAGFETEAAGLMGTEEGEATPALLAVLRRDTSVLAGWIESGEVVMPASVTGPPLEAGPGEVPGS